MNWIKTASASALAAGAILLSAGCTSKKDVAIAAKDDTIRRQEAAISSADQQAKIDAENAARAAQLNQQLSQQNSELAERNARATAQQTAAINQSTARLGELQNEVATLDSIVKGLNAGQNKTIVVTQPGAPIQHEGQVGNVSRHADGIHIQVAGSVLFDPGHAELKPSCSDTLMRIAQTIKAQYPNHAIRIEGHTDCTPVVHSRDKFPDNMALSQARAQAVYDFMAKRGGMSSGKMYTAGYGERQPLVTPEKTAADRAKNRRVEIVILPNNLKVQKDQLTHAEGQARPFNAAVTVSAAQK